MQVVLSAFVFYVRAFVRQKTTGWMNAFIIRIKESRDRINSQVFKALKSGGYYGVVDHTQRHMEPDNNENRRRLDPVLVIKELLDHGFEFVGYSNLHYRADDELEYEVGRRSVSGNTDRFTLLFRKP